MNARYTLPMSTWINLANTLAETSLERMQELTERIQKRQYSPSDVITDTLGFWVDGVNGWWSVMQQTAAGPVPYAFVKMRSDEESALAEVPIRKSGNEALKWTPLAPLSEGGAGVALSIDVTWANDKPNCAVVRVHGLNADQVEAKKKLRHGLFQSSVHMNNQLVGIVQILIED